MKIIITDLTKFRNEEMFCAAGIELNSGKCVRPMPYLNSNTCKRLNILPGGILSGKFVRKSDSTPPHTEDMNYRDLKFNGQCPSEEFENLLAKSTTPSLEKGFNFTLSDGQKHIPIEDPPKISITTLHISPYQIKILENQFKSGKIILNFTDSSGRSFRYIPISDLGYYNFAQRNASDLNNAVRQLNAFIRKQSDVYLRIGLTRPFKSKDGRNGYWIQVNGIYTFPNYYEDIRYHT